MISLIDTTHINLICLSSHAKDVEARGIIEKEEEMHASRSCFSAAASQVQVTSSCKSHSHTRPRLPVSVGVATTTTTPSCDISRQLHKSSSSTWSPALFQLSITNKNEQSIKPLTFTSRPNTYENTQTIHPSNLHHGFRCQRQEHQSAD